MKNNRHYYIKKYVQWTEKIPWHNNAVRNTVILASNWYFTYSISHLHENQALIFLLAFAKNNLCVHNNNCSCAFLKTILVTVSNIIMGILFLVKCVNLNDSI